MSSPLVAMIGVSKYKQSIDVDGVDVDYKNVQQLFGSYFGYDTHFQFDNTSNSSSFKGKWKSRDMERFIKDIRKSIRSHYYDGLIFVIAGDGDFDMDLKDCLTDTYGNLHPFQWFVEQFF